jgi:hypothetical protein
MAASNQFIRIILLFSQLVSIPGSRVQGMVRNGTGYFTDAIQNNVNNAFS